MSREGYPGDASDEEWAFVAPYLAPMSEDAPQRSYRLREVFDRVDRNRWRDSGEEPSDPVFAPGKRGRPYDTRGSETRPGGS